MSENTKKMFNANSRELLLKIARSSIEGKLAKEEITIPKSADLEAVSGKNGVFVTLHKKGSLRGCIGNFVSDKPLYRLVMEMALSAAFRDPRFPPLAQAELDKIDIEISVLSPLEPCKDIEEIMVGRHGIYLINGYNRGVLLPQVATDYGWDRNTFLDQTCVKAGMQPGCWKHPETEILVFSAEIFGEISEGLLGKG